MKVPEFSQKFGTDADETLIGASGRDLIHGNGGNDNLVLDPAYFVAVARSAGTVQGTASGHGQFVFSSTASTLTLMWMRMARALRTASRSPPSTPASP